jgi:hypothetical protein
MAGVIAAWLTLSTVPDRARASAYTAVSRFAAAATSRSPYGRASTCLSVTARWSFASHGKATAAGSSPVGAGSSGAAVPDSLAVASGDGVADSSPTPVPSSSRATRARAGLPLASRRAESGTAGSTSQVIGRPPAASPKSRTEES